MTHRITAAEALAFRMALVLVWTAETSLDPIDAIAVTPDAEDAVRILDRAMYPDFDGVVEGHTDESRAVWMLACPLATVTPRADDDGPYVRLDVDWFALDRIHAA